MEELCSEMRSELIRVAHDAFDHVRNRSITRARGMEVDPAVYSAPDQHQQERDRLFRRVPLMLAASSELSRPGNYKAMEVAGVPLILVRRRDGSAGALLNICTHRANFLVEGCGHTARFTCPFHGWTYGLDGKLIGVASRKDFGPIDATRKGLRQLPVLEKAGLIWVILDPDSPVDIDAFLMPFSGLLKGFGLGGMKIASSRTLAGSNWKLAIEAHLDWYHLPVLHRDSFGAQCSNRALYYFYGPHVRMVRPAPESPPAPPHLDLLSLEGTNEAQWPLSGLMLGGWIAFPNTTLFTLHRKGRRIVNLNQIFPGNDARSSYTVQSFLVDEDMPEDDVVALSGTFDFIEGVVRDEDLQTSAKQQRAIESGLAGKLCFGENEEGCVALHQWIDRVLATEVNDLNRLFLP